MLLSRTEPDVIPAHAPRELIAIGGSAGSIVALRAILAALPANLPAAIAVVVHLDPHRPSQLAHVLGFHSALPVRCVAGREPIEPGVVYVAGPDRHLITEGGMLALSDAPPVNRSRPSVDVLFESVAEAFGPRAIGLVLTGYGHDGAAGIRALRRCGSLTMLEEPSGALHPSMPAAALATGCVDVCLPVLALGAALDRLVHGLPFIYARRDR